jgi:hypothetical protein
LPPLPAKLGPGILKGSPQKPTTERRERREMEELERMIRLVDALENIAVEMERLRLLKEYELGARIEHGAGGSYVKANEE